MLIDRRRNLKARLYVVERSIIEVEGLLKQFHSILHQQGTLQTSFLPAQARIVNDRAAKELFRIRDRISRTGREIDDQLGGIAVLVEEQAYEKLSSLREEFIRSYRETINSNTFEDFIGASSRLLGIGFRIVRAVREHYNLSS